MKKPFVIPATPLVNFGEVIRARQGIVARDRVGVEDKSAYVPPKRRSRSPPLREPAREVRPGIVARERVDIQTPPPPPPPEPVVVYEREEPEIVYEREEPETIYEPEPEIVYEDYDDGYYEDYYEPPLEYEPYERQYGRQRVAPQPRARYRRRRRWAWAPDLLTVLLVLAVLLVAVFVTSLTKPEWFGLEPGSSIRGWSINSDPNAAAPRAPPSPPSPPPPPPSPPSPHPPPPPSPPPPSPPWAPPPPTHPPLLPSSPRAPCADDQFWFAEAGASPTTPTDETCASLEVTHGAAPCVHAELVATHRLFAVDVTPLLACCFCNGHRTFAYALSPSSPAPPTQPFPLLPPAAPPRPL